VTASNFIQNFVSSRRNVSDGNVRIGDLDRLWYDPITNTIRVGNGSPGGKIVSGGGGSGTANIATYSNNTLLTPTVSSLNFTGNGISANVTGNDVTVTVAISSYIFDGGSPSSNYSVGPAFDCGGVT